MGPDERPAIDRDLARSSISGNTRTLPSSRRHPILRNYVNRKMYSFCPFKTLQPDTVAKYTVKQQTHNLSHKLNLRILFERNRLTKRYTWALHWGRRKLNCAGSYTEHIIHINFEHTAQFQHSSHTHQPHTTSAPFLWHWNSSNITDKIVRINSQTCL